MPKKILILRPGAMGDVCMATPFAAALARHAEVHWLIHQIYEPIPRLFNVDVRLIPLAPCRRKITALSDPPLIPPALIDQLQRERYDAILDLAHWPLTAQLVQHLPTVPLRAITFDPDQDARLSVNPHGLDLYAPFNERSEIGRTPHQVSKWQMLAKEALGIDVNLDWPLPPSPRSTARTPLRLFVHPHASKPEKRWPAERFAEVIRGLARDREVICRINSGSRRELPTAVNLWLRLIAAGIRARITWLDRSCRRLRRALEGSDVALGCDSGPMHLAALLGTPSVVIFGPHRGAEFGPLWRSCPVEPAVPGMPASCVASTAVVHACRQSEAFA